MTTPKMTLRQHVGLQILSGIVASTINESIFPTANETVEEARERLRLSDVKYALEMADLFLKEEESTR